MGRLRRQRVVDPRAGYAGTVTRPKLGIVVPLANERAAVDALLRGVLCHLDGGDALYCVLDGVSQDGTRERVAHWERQDARVRLVWAPENRCVVDAYFAGYRAALDGDCEWILEMDGGLSHRPEEIPRFLRSMRSGVDFAAGSRFVAGGSYRGSKRRYALSRGGTMLANVLLGTRMHDMTGGFECFSRGALEHVVARGVHARAHFFQTEIRHMLHDWSWVEVPISYRDPSPRVGSASILEALRILWQLRGRHEH